MPTPAVLAAIRAQIAAVETGTRSPAGVLRLGDPAIDSCFPGGGLPLGAWHEITGEGMEVETGAAPAVFAAQLARVLCAKGEAVWVTRRDDLYPPGLCGFGMAAERLIQVKARNEDEVLAVLEEALSTRGVAVAVAEADAVSLPAGRRLQLACERGGTTGLVLQRRPYGGLGRKAAAPGTAAASRWKIASAPSAAGSGGMGFGALRWKTELLRCRGGRSGAWILEEAGDGPHPFRVARGMADHGLAAPERLRRFG
jgi:protein ImuA